MWTERLHILAPLAFLTSKTVKWSWGNIEHTAFDTIKKIVANEVLLLYLDFTKPFQMYTDASHLQLDAIITQSEKPIAYWSRKLNTAQTRYTTTERKLLSIVEALQEFRNVLLGRGTAQRAPQDSALQIPVSIEIFPFLGREAPACSLNPTCRQCFLYPSQ
jgi:hypothetical protein